MSMMTRVSDWLSRSGQSMVSMVKLVMQTRPASITKAKRQGGRIIILGNGPSLNDTIAKHRDVLTATATMAVNFAANAPVFVDLKPRYYILVDPLFFSGKDLPNLNSLWSNLGAVDWTMTLIVPVAYRDKVPQSVVGNPNVDIATINAIAIEGWRWLTDMAYGRGWGMARPRNVLIPAIMSAIQMGYKEIYITGADHSWMSTISVNENNEVVSVQPHFYKEDDREIKRINTEYLHYPLHQIIHSFYVAFKSYHDIQQYAQRHGVSIYNATPGSFIDAFPRSSLVGGRNYKPKNNSVESGVCKI